MSKLSQLKDMTLVVADTGDIQQIKAYQPQDATTNPSLLLKAVSMPEYQNLFDNAVTNAKQTTSEHQVAYIMDQLSVGIGAEITKTIPGRISTEVDARLSFDTQSTVDSAKRIIDLYEAADVDRDRVLIKIAATWEGIQAAKELEKTGIHCNLTLIFHIAQAVACAEAGVTLISPFVGRITDWYKKHEGAEAFPPVNEDEGVLSVKDIYNYFKYFNYETTVMGASFRHVGQVEALAGCDALTISPQLLSELDQDNGSLEQVLSKEKLIPNKRIDCSEPAFRWMMNDSPMATEKLAEGIRNFALDSVKLENIIKAKLAH